MTKEQFKNKQTVDYYKAQEGMTGTYNRAEIDGNKFMLYRLLDNKLLRIICLKTFVDL